MIAALQSHPLAQVSSLSIVTTFVFNAGPLIRKDHATETYSLYLVELAVSQGIRTVHRNEIMPVYPFAASSAWLMSAMISSTCSMPM
ncbi:MAG: hypothetical protein K1563_17505, partial [Candidatus Thiodiazotropha sp. (ex. Lucinisca nassula)]|nr:hypothetical protein [Candidatus Thiodiazotropha sp. (ex. Lucinisca nassula)]